VVWLIAGCAAAWLAIIVVNYFEGENVVLDVRDEFRVAALELAALDHAADAAPRSETTVCLTTTPTRLPYIADTLKSLLTQTRVPKSIRLHVPHFSVREQRAYVVPEILRNLRNVTIIECEDWGPATKLLPALQGLQPHESVIVVDDDRIYPRHLVATLEDAARADPDAAFGFGGWIAPADLTDRPTTIVSNLLQRPPAPVRATRLRKRRRVDVLQGLAGYLVRPRFFNLATVTDYSAAPPAARTVDDVWISGHCRAPKFVLPSRRCSFEPWRRRGFYGRTALGRLNRAADHRQRNNSIMLRHFAGTWSAGRDGAG
jgi:hypothetical protein